MVRNVFRLDDRQIASLMVPCSENVYFDVNEPQQENLRRFEHSEHSRFAVLHGGWEQVLGVANGSG